MAGGGISARIGRWWRSRAAERDLEDPERLRGKLDETYREQIQMLTRVRRGVAEVATSRKRVEVQMAQLQRQIEDFDARSRDAVGRGDDDAARDALTRKVTLEKAHQELAERHASLTREEQSLEQAATRVERQIEDFRLRKDTLTARYSAASARHEINDATRGISSATSEIGQAMDEAERHTRELEATANAVDELVAEGIVTRPGESPDDALARHFDAALGDLPPLDQDKKGNDGPHQISS